MKPISIDIFIDENGEVSVNVESNRSLSVLDVVGALEAAKIMVLTGKLDVTSSPKPQCVEL